MKAIIHAKVVFPDRIVEDGGILIENGRIAASGRIDIPDGAAVIDAKGLYAGPGLVDEHVHGYQQCGEALSGIHEVEAVAKAHLKHGTTSITPSTGYNFTHDEFIEMIDRCNAAIERGDTSIVGIHFEGPFTNPGYGSMSEKAWKYSREVCEEIFDRAGKNVLHCTYAPEMEDAPEFELFLRDRNVIADIGHTCAGPKDMERAFARGARIMTHLYDAMGHHLGVEAAAKATGDVQDATSQIALATPGIYCELICDSSCAHVSKYNAAMALRAAGEDHIVLVTDSTCKIPQYPPDESHPEWKIVSDLNFNIRGQLSGSRLTLNRACANFMRMTGADIRVAFKCASTNPARALNLPNVGSVEAGKTANIILVDEGFNIKAVYFRGRALPEVRN